MEGDAELKRLTQNEAQDPPVLHLDSMYEIEDGDGMSTTPKGRTFFPEKLWWQFWK